MTLWGKQAESFNAAPGSIGAFKGIRVGDFGGRCQFSLMVANPDTFHQGYPSQ